MKKIIIAAGIFLVAFLVSTYFIGKSDTYNVQKEIAEEIIRFHVRANSDSEEDQRIKLLVRDEVSAYVTKLLEESDSLEETVAIIQANMEQINDVANQVLVEEGVSYTAETSLAYVDFPKKQYNDCKWKWGVCFSYRKQQ